MKTATRNNRRRTGKRMELLLFPILAVLLGVAIFLIGRFAEDESQMKLESPVYQFFTDGKAEYAAGTKLIPGTGEQFQFEEAGGETSSGDVSPIYFADSAAILLPTAMSWMDPITNREWRLEAFSRLERQEEGGVLCRWEDGEYDLESGFLSNGRGTYVFLEGASLLCNGLEYEISPLSFYSIAGGMIRIYDYESDTLIVLPELTENTQVRYSGGYSADLSVGIYTAPNGDQRLLAAGPKTLKGIGER